MLIYWLAYVLLVAYAKIITREFYDHRDGSFFETKNVIAQPGFESAFDDLKR